MSMKEDLIGRNDLVKTIASLVKHLSKDEHYCLALDGEWGSGKSFVIDMLENDLKTNNEYFIVKYDAWENSFYSDPLIAILYCILDGLQDNFYYIRGIKEYGEAAINFAKNAGKTVKELAKTVDPTGTIEKVFSLISTIVDGIKSSIKILKMDKTGNEIFADFKSYKSLLNDIKETLNKLACCEIFEGKRTKLIILVDEIDRCLPNEQLIILERLHHLMDIKNCFVICSLNKESMIQNFNYNFKNNGDDYLKKFFDKEIHLDSYSEKYFDNYLTQKLDEIAEEKNIPISNDQKAHLKEFINYVLIKENVMGDNHLSDNRDIKRILDSVEKTAQNVSEITNFEHICIIVLLVVLKNYVTKHYGQIIVNTTRTYKAPIDFVSSYVPANVFDHVRSSIYSFSGEPYNIYIYSYLNYYNQVLNYHTFGEQANDFYIRDNFYKELDAFTKNFEHILKKVETYGK